MIFRISYCLVSWLLDLIYYETTMLYYLLEYIFCKHPCVCRPDQQQHYGGGCNEKYVRMESKASPSCLLTSWRSSHTNAQWKRFSAMLVVVGDTEPSRAYRMSNVKSFVGQLIDANAKIKRKKGATKIISKCNNTKITGNWSLSLFWPNTTYWICCYYNLPHLLLTQYIFFPNWLY